MIFIYFSSVSEFQNFIYDDSYITYPLKIMHIPAMVYFIIDPASQRSGRGVGGPSPMHNF